MTIAELVKWLFNEMTTNERFDEVEAIEWDQDENTLVVHQFDNRSIVLNVQERREA